MERQNPSLEGASDKPKTSPLLEGIRIEAAPVPTQTQSLNDLMYGTAQVPLPSEVRRLLERESGKQPLQRFFKRLLDVTLSALALLTLSPFLLLLGLLVKLDNPGPMLFTQMRVGRGGRLFRLYKFRTMVPQAEALKNDLLQLNEADGPAFKMKRDPRVTRMGRWLRRTSFDELPQLWNVLIGDMSLVGPRPALPVELIQWEPWQMQRLSVEQGCTCIWQVNGRNHDSFEAWMRMDLEYVRGWSLLLDLRLILRTLWVMLTGRGGY